MYFFGLPKTMTGEVGERTTFTTLSDRHNYIVGFNENKTNKSSPITHFMVITKTPIDNSNIKQKYITCASDQYQSYLLDRITEVHYLQPKERKAIYITKNSGFFDDDPVPVYTIDNITEDDKMDRRTKKSYVKNGIYNTHDQVIFFTGKSIFTPDVEGLFEADCYTVYR